MLPSQRCLVPSLCCSSQCCTPLRVLLSRCSSALQCCAPSVSPVLFSKCCPRSWLPRGSQSQNSNGFTVLPLTVPPSASASFTIPVLSHGRPHRVALSHITAPHIDPPKSGPLARCYTPHNVIFQIYIQPLIERHRNAKQVLSPCVLSCTVFPRCCLVYSSGLFVVLPSQCSCPSQCCPHSAAVPRIAALTMLPLTVCPPCSVCPSHAVLPLTVLPTRRCPLHIVSCMIALTVLHPTVAAPFMCNVACLRVLSISLNGAPYSMV